MEISYSEFKKNISSEKVCLIDFWASWCAPCKMAGPVIDQLEKDYAGKVKVGKLNVDENLQIPQKYVVMSIPTVIIFKNGKEIKRQVGFPGKEGYIKILEEALKD